MSEGPDEPPVSAYAARALGLAGPYGAHHGGYAPRYGEGERYRLPRACEWEFTTYALTRVGTPFEVEAGRSVSPFPDPVTFSGGRVRVRRGGVAPVRHLLRPPCGSGHGRVGRFAVGRLVTGVVHRRPAWHPRAGRLRARFVLSCAFQVARAAVPAGSTLAEAHGLRRLRARLGMRGGPGHDGPYFYHYDDMYHRYKPRDGRRRGAGAQRFDRVGWQWFPRGSDPRCVDQEPAGARTVALGAGWEGAGGPAAFEAIAGHAVEPLLAVDCRRPPGWFRDVDLSALLDWRAPEGAGGATLWLGLWVTSDPRHPIDYPDGVPPLALPGPDDRAVETRIVLDQSGVMGTWEVSAS